MDTFLLESADGQLIFRIKAESKAIADAFVRLQGRGYTEEEIKEVVGEFAITGAWETWAAHKAKTS